NMIINTNRLADILEGTCECVAGNGPQAAYYTYVPKASTTLNQLLIKYGQKSSAAAFFLLPREDKNSFINLPARVIGAVSNSPNFILNSLMLKFYQDHVYLLPSQISNLEEITHGQSSSDQWYKCIQHSCSKK
ncbi:unnamed protein product, partial [Adineta steineri]